MNKACINCKKEVIPNKFNPNKKFCSKKCSRQYHYNTHKDVENANAKKWYSKNRDSEIAKNKEYREQNRELFHWYKNRDRFDGLRDVIFNLYDNKCIACDSTYRLSVHHKDGGGNHKCIPGVIANNDINNLVLLCGSCHTRLHHWQRRNKEILLDNKLIIKIIKSLNV
jgi:hypothetical protein